MPMVCVGWRVQGFSQQNQQSKYHRQLLVVARKTLDTSYLHLVGGGLFFFLIALPWYLKVAYNG